MERSCSQLWFDQPDTLVNLNTLETRTLLKKKKITLDTVVIIIVVVIFTVAALYKLCFISNSI